MTALKRLIKTRELERYLAGAREAFADALSISVFEGESRIASSGEPAPDRHTKGAIRMPLRTSAGAPAELVLACDAGKTATGQPLEPFARLLAESLQTRINTEEARRAVSAETLDVYRELALLHRAAVDLNRSLRQIEVAEALLKEFQLGRESNAADTGLVLQRDPEGGQMTPLCSFAGKPDRDLSPIAASALLRAVVDSGKGEIVNDLEGDPRWQGEVSGLKVLLLIPLTAHDSCSGALVLGRFGEGADFSSADLKRAETLASVAAAALHNARLFEAVVEIKNYNESVLQNLSNGVITLDEARRVSKTNAAALRILGRAGEDLVGLSLEAIFAGENRWVATNVDEVIAAETSGSWIDRELQVGDGVGVSVNITAVPLQRLEEAAAGYILLLEDITREKRIKGTMVRFMSDRVVEKLLDAEDSLLGGSAQVVSVLFSDIRDFTRLSERLSAPDMVSMLNDYFSEMVDIIFERGGTLDKFIGDAIMAVFGAPFTTEQDTDNAVETAIEMIKRLERLNREWQAGGRPRFNIGIGINTGSVVAGTIGSPKRMDYTVIGDHVNLASRIESANKFYGTRVLISEHTLASINCARRVREIDWVRVQGRETRVGLYEVLDYHTEKSFPALDRVLAAYERGLGHYRAGEWKQAADCFADALAQNPNDKPAQLFFKRCAKLAKKPPASAWSAVTDLSVEKSLSY